MSRYFNEADTKAILRDYPIGKAFSSGIARASRDVIRALQERRLLALRERAGGNPLYRRRSIGP